MISARDQPSTSCVSSDLYSSFKPADLSFHMFSCASTMFKVGTQEIAREMLLIKQQCRDFRNVDHV
jgi:hypothetical protein